MSFVSKLNSSLSIPLIKPSLPAFIPRADLFKNAAFLAILRVVPSPPIAIAQSQSDIALSKFSNFAFVDLKIGLYSF